jgi:hypothetical protein
MINSQQQYNTVAIFCTSFLLCHHPLNTFCHFLYLTASLMLYNFSPQIAKRSNRVDIFTMLMILIESLIYIFDFDLNLIVFEKMFVTIFCFNRIRNKHEISAH